MDTQPRKWVGLQEISSRLGRSPWTVYSWVRRGLVPHGRAGRTLVFDVDAVDRWCAERGGPGRLDFPPSDAQTKQQQAEEIAGRILSKG